MRANVAAYLRRSERAFCERYLPRADIRQEARIRPGVGLRADTKRFLPDRLGQCVVRHLRSRLTPWAMLKLRLTSPLFLVQLERELAATNHQSETDQGDHRTERCDQGIFYWANLF